MANYSSCGRFTFFTFDQSAMVWQSQVTAKMGQRAGLKTETSALEMALNHLLFESLKTGAFPTGMVAHFCTKSTSKRYKGNKQLVRVFPISVEEFEQQVQTAIFAALGALKVLRLEMALDDPFLSEMVL